MTVDWDPILNAYNTLVNEPDDQKAGHQFHSGISPSVLRLAKGFKWRGARVSRSVGDLVQDVHTHFESGFKAKRFKAMDCAPALRAYIKIISIRCLITVTKEPPGPHVIHVDPESLQSEGDSIDCTRSLENSDEIKHIFGLVYLRFDADKYTRAALCYLMEDGEITLEEAAALHDIPLEPARIRAKNIRKLRYRKKRIVDFLMVRGEW